MVNYSQSTSLSRGGFAPSVNYNATVRMPTQPIPDLKQPDSKFNIDLSDLSRGIMYAAHQERLAQKEAATQAEKERVAALKVGLGRELNQIQMGVDQNAFSAEAGQRKSREALDKYIGIGLDPDEVFPIYENSVSADVRDVYANRRKVAEETKNAVNGEKLKDLYKAIPSTANWSTEDALRYVNANEALGDELALTLMNGGDINGVSGRLINAQGHSTVLNLIQGIQDGSVSKEEAKMQVYQSATMAYAKRNPNMSASEIEYLVQKNLKGVNDWIDMLAAAKQGEQKLVADRYDTLTKSLQLEGFDHLSPEDKVKAAFKLLDPIDDKGIFGPKATEVGVAAVTSSGGRTTTAQKQFLVRDISGNQMLVTAADSQEAIKIMDNGSKMVYPEGSIATPFIKQAIPQSYASPNVDVQGFTNLSDTDITTLAENRTSVGAIAGSVNMRNTFKNDPDTLKYVDNQSSVTAGLFAYKDVPGVKEIVQNNDNYVRALKGNEAMLANTRINSEGYLVAATDVQGVLGTMQQYITGAKYRSNLNQINDNLKNVPLMHRANVAKLHLASYGLSVNDYDPTVDGDMTSEPLFGETTAQKIYEVGKKGWEYGDKGIRKFDKEVFMPLQNKIEEIITPYLDEVINNAPAVFKDLKGGEGTYRDHLINSVKEATNDYVNYVGHTIDTYKTLQQVGKEAPGIANVVNKPEAGQVLQEFLDLLKTPSKVEESLAELDNVPSISKIETSVQPVVPATASMTDDVKTKTVEIDGITYIMPTTGDTSEHFGGYATHEDAEKAAEVIKPLTPKEEKTFFKYLEEETNKLVDLYVEELSEIASPAIDNLDAFKTGWRAGQSLTSGGSTHSLYDEWATMLNRIGKKPAGFIRQVVALAPYTFGVVSGGTWEGVKALYGSIMSEGFELSTEAQQKLEQIALQAQRAVYKRDPSLWERFMNNSADKYKFFPRHKGDVRHSAPYYYGNKKVDEENQALMEPFLYD